MADLYGTRTEKVKPECTSVVLYRGKDSVRDTYMTAKAGKKVVPRPKGPHFKPTFIKQWRVHRNLTQEQLAERVSAYLAGFGDDSGYTYASIGRIENGKMGYTQATLEAIADALETDPASLLIRDPTDKSAIWSLWDRAHQAERDTITEHAEIVLRRAAK